MQKVFVSDIRPSDSFTSYFMIVKREKKLKRNGEPYIRLTLADRTGMIAANVWDNVAACMSAIADESVVCVEATAQEYNGKVQLSVASITPCGQDTYEIAALIKTLPNIPEVFDRLTACLNTVKNSHLQSLLRTVLSDTDFLDRFMHCPGGMKWHHAYIGGLLQHTYEVVTIAGHMCALHPEVDRDLVLTGAFLHDIGKIEELDYDMNFDYTDAGRLIGHICIGHRMLHSFVQRIPAFPSELLGELEHIVLSHQGTYEQQSPVVPKTIEACIVYHSDLLTSQTSAFKSVVYGPRLEGETWSRYYPTIERQLLLRDEKEDVL